MQVLRMIIARGAGARRPGDSRRDAGATSTGAATLGFAVAGRTKCVRPYVYLRPRKRILEVKARPSQAAKVGAG